MAEQQQQSTALVTQRQGVITKFATAYDLEPAKVLSIVANTIFRANKQEDALSQEEIAAALIVCNAYSLNPFTKEIYAFRSKGKLLIVVGVDGSPESRRAVAVAWKLAEAAHVALIPVHAVPDQRR